MITKKDDLHEKEKTNDDDKISKNNIADDDKILATTDPANSDNENDDSNDANENNDDIKKAEMEEDPEPAVAIVGDNNIEKESPIEPMLRPSGKSKDDLSITTVCHIIINRNLIPIISLDKD